MGSGKDKYIKLLQLHLGIQILGKEYYLGYSILETSEHVFSADHDIA